MAQYIATYKCAHNENVVLFGAIQDRKRKLDWMRTQLCPACRRKAKEERTGIKLVGSDKQANWAYDIRERFIAILEELAKEVNAQFADVFEQAREEIMSHTEAKWWIENEVKCDKYAVAKMVQEIANNAKTI